MKALVTGANGFIGSLLTQQLVAKGVQVKCLVLETELLGEISDLDVEIIYGDLCDKDSLGGPVKDVNYIYHLAAIKQSWDESLLYEVNVSGFENLLQATLESNPHLKKFLFVSSQAAVGPNLQTEPLTELNVCTPVDHYGKSKYQAEEIAKQYMDKIPLTIVRPTSIYGPKNLGPSVTANIISFTRWGLFLMPLPFSRTMHPIHVQDVVDGIIAATEREQTGGNIYFITNSEAITWTKFVKTCYKVRGKRGWLLPLPRFIIRIAVYLIALSRILFGKPYRGIFDQLNYIRYNDWRVSGAAAKVDFGFEPQISLEGGLTETVQWFDQHSKKES